MMALRRPLRLLAAWAQATWLPLTLALAAAVLVAVNTLALPVAAPALAWGPSRPSVGVFVSGRGPERQVRTLVRGEIEQYLGRLPADQGRISTISVLELQRIRRLQGSGLGDLAAAAPAGRREEQARNRPGGDLPMAALPGQPVPERGALSQTGAAVTPAAAPDGFMVPLGLHRPGVEGVGLYALSLVSFAAITALLVLLLPARFRTARDALLTGHPLKALAVGVLAYLLAALLSLFLVMLVVGGPLASLVLGAMVLLSVAGLVTVTLAIGRLLLRRTGHGAGSPPLELATGVLALYLASIVPYLGWAVVLAASSVGLGSLILTRFGSGEPWSLRALE